jgi:hypothetical protein
MFRSLTSFCMNRHSLIIAFFSLVASVSNAQQHLKINDPVLPDPNEPVQVQVQKGNDKTKKTSSQGDAMMMSMALTQTFDLRSDSLALVDLYNSANGPQWLRKTNWLIGRVSTWQGVLVSNNRVVRVQLQSNNLSGTIPESIGNLTALNWLHLYLNNLSGSIHFLQALVIY